MSRIHLVQFLARAARVHPDRNAIAFQDREQTWRQLNAASEQLAAGLRRIGVLAGDRVAILALNSDRYVEMLFAIWRLAAVAVPLNTRWSRGEIRYAAGPGLRSSTTPSSRSSKDCPPARSFTWERRRRRRP